MDLLEKKLGWSQGCVRHSIGRRTIIALEDAVGGWMIKVHTRAVPSAVSLKWTDGHLDLEP